MDESDGDSVSGEKLVRPKSTKFSSVARSLMMLKRIHGEAIPEDVIINTRAMPPLRAQLSKLSGKGDLGAKRRQSLLNRSSAASSR